MHVISLEYGKPASPKVAPAKLMSGTRLREARFEDYEQIAALESRFNLAVKPNEEWVHLWQGNPLYRELRRDWPIGWVLEDKDGRIVGSMGNIPLLYELGGRKILAATGRHWVADLAHRSEAILLLDSLISQPYVDLYVNTTVSRAAVPAVAALGCSRVPVGIWDEVAYWITNYAGCLKSVFAAKNGFVRPSWKGSWTHLKAIGRQLSKFSRRRFLSAESKDRDPRKVARSPAFEVTVCTDFDDRFNHFWEDLKRRNPHLLLAARSREYLQWHFKYAMLGERTWIATILDGRRICAYAIFCKAVNLTSGIHQVKLADYQSLDGSPTLLEPLVAWALEQCRSEGMHILEHTGRWLEQGEFFDNACPYRRNLQAWQYFYRVNNPDLIAPLSDTHSWAPSLFDGEATL